MALIEIKKDPSKEELRWFGLLFLLFFGIVGSVLKWKGWIENPNYMWGIAAIVTALYYLVPPLRKPLYLGWLYLFFPLGWVVSHLVLGITYYLVLAPIGLCLRAFGHDPMRRKLDSEAESYWIKHVPADNAARYFRQF
jgi:protein-S-isoprenylcysteine O-methyltransferase Ste14